MSAMYQTFQNTPIFQTAWRGFLGSKWTDEVNVRDFIQNNYTQYDGDESFLAAPTSATHLLWERLQKLQKEEHEKGGVLECETEIVSSLTAMVRDISIRSLKIWNASSDFRPTNHSSGFYAVRRNQDGGGSRRNLRLPCQFKIS